MQWLKALYLPIYNLCGGNEAVLGALGSYVVVTVSFWGLNAPFLYADITGKPQWLRKYKVQAGKNEPVDRAQLKRAMKTAIFNMVFLNLVFSYQMYKGMHWAGMTFDPEGVTSFSWFLVEFVVYALVQEVIFYYTHRLIHHPWLYSWIHKKHHQWTAPISIVSIYATPLEYIVGNSTSVYLGPLLMRSHVTSQWLWYFLATLFTTVHHSGYHLPFLPSPQFHDYHHLTFNWNFGTLGILDKFHGTDAQFKRSVQSKRHRFHRWLTPMHLIVPEP